MSEEQIQAIDALRENLLLVLEDVSDVALHLREAKEFGSRSIEAGDMCLREAVESAEAAMQRLREIALKAEEVSP